MAGYSPGARHAGVPAPRRPRPGRASTTWPAGWPSGAASCSSGTTSTAPCRRSASCSTTRCSRSASSWPATSTGRRDRLPRDAAGEPAAVHGRGGQRAAPTTTGSSREAREDYEQIKDLLGRELLDQRFAGMKQALENATDEDRAAINEMLDDLNELLDEAPPRRGHRRRTSHDFMDKHGDFFPENPQNVDELIDALGPARGRRPADAQLDDARAARGADAALAAGVRLARS